MTYPQSLTDYIATLPYSPSPEQHAIIREAITTDDNLIISALAGAAKTSTLKLIAYALPDVSTLALAFNKSIATTLQQELPPNCEARTLNSLGHSVWAQYLRLRRLDLKKNKMYGILKEHLDTTQFSPSDSEALSDAFSSLLKYAGIAKAHGHLPDAFFSSLSRHHKVTRILSDDELLDLLPDRLTDLETDVLFAILNTSAEQSMKGIIDFGDQVLFPSTFKCMYPYHPLILVDETQDLSPLNHLMLAQLYRKRIIAVGDSCQAIYAFRGAFADGMEQLKQRFSCTELTLSVSYRCPQAVVDQVLWRAPHMTAAKSGGTYTPATLPNLSSLPRTCAIICRNNAPLFSAAIKLLREQRYPKLWGNDIAATLLTTMKSLGDRGTATEEAKIKLLEWKKARLRKVKSAGAVEDQYLCLLHLIEEGAPTLGRALDLTEQVLNSSGTVHLLTAHKSKGHEFDNVYILDDSLFRVDMTDEQNQDGNVKYVAYTRACENLTIWLPLEDE